MAQSSVSDQITKLERNIRVYERQYARDTGSVKLLAVSKTRELNEIKAAIRAGQSAFGENYAQELDEKSRTIGPEVVEWHFIGKLQSNKAKVVAAHADWVHTIDRQKVADKLQSQLESSDRRINVCIQLNIDNEDTKAGVDAAELPAIADHIEKLSNLKLRGIMCIPKTRTTVDAQRKIFAEARNQQESLISRGHRLDTLSFGMSNDYEAAIAEGATIVRIGTAIFGPRQSN